MNRRVDTIKTGPLLGLTVAVFVAFITSSMLMPTTLRLNGDNESRSIVGALLGRTRLGLSSHFYEMADLYLHRGVDHVRKCAFTDSPFQRIAAEISPERVTHASGRELQEMIPWLWLAVRSDSHNTDSYLVAAFLAAGELGRFDVAHQILAEARWNNPLNYQIQMEEGRVYFKEKKFAEAVKCFDIALAFLASRRPSDIAAAKDDEASILLYRSMLREKTGDKSGAVRDLKAIIELFPERSFLNEHIARIEKGREASDLATRKWNDIIRKNEEMKATCHTDHDSEEDHAHSGNRDHKQ